MGYGEGMMQYLDGTAAGLGINPFDPAQAIDAAAQQFAERLAKGYSPEEAVQAHFAGTTARCGRIKPSVIGKRFWSGRRRSSASICSGRRPSRSRRCRLRRSLKPKRSPMACSRAWGGRLGE